jgi:hypothetical protein
MYVKVYSVIIHNKQSLQTFQIFFNWWTVLVFYGCYNKSPYTLWLKTMEIYYFMILEA